MEENDSLSVTLRADTIDLCWAEFRPQLECRRGPAAPVPTPRLSAAPRFEGCVPWASPAPVPDPTAGVPSLSWTPRPGSRLVPVSPRLECCCGPPPCYPRDPRTCS
ncbi:hypothetical protein SKAU_G00191220 [Synaphobranchus kaupii]|uniref:Uncharacterized protein n=1 Tax=Synaphobranchus kaupii TaxID=118154 RepID=A0A9Q1FDH8_SYNKA|nr:hypothetical protein SKAU_G00191220 [Synaphobranchus kaupii]